MNLVTFSFCDKITTHIYIVFKFINEKHTVSLFYEKIN